MLHGVEQRPARLAVRRATVKQPS